MPFWWVPPIIVCHIGEIQPRHGNDGIMYRLVKLHYFYKLKIVHMLRSSTLKHVLIIKAGPILIPRFFCFSKWLVVRGPTCFLLIS